MNMIFNFVKNTDVRILILCLAAMFFLSISARAQGNCTMVCKGQVNVTLAPETCTAILTPADLSNATCQGDYTLEILTTSNVVIASGTNEVVISQVGNFLYRVTNAGIPCWGNISIEDKGGPVKDLSYGLEPLTEVCGIPDTIDPSGITDLATEYVSCLVAKSGYSIEPWFDVLEEDDFLDCSGIEGIYNFTREQNYCDLTEQISYTGPAGWEPHQVWTRGWYAIDIDGNISDTCYQQVISIRPLAEMITLEDYIEQECNSTEAVGYGPSFVDVENLPGGDFLTCPASSGAVVAMTPGLYCGYIVSVNCDAKVPTCSSDIENVYKEVCRWTVADWCTGSLLYDSFAQVFEVKDGVAPSLAEGTTAFYAAPYDCAANLVVGAATVDMGLECTEIVAWQTIVEYSDMSSGGFFEKKESATNGIAVNGIPSSAEVKVIWRATDACGNVGEKEVSIMPTDSNAPVCVVNDELNVGLIINDPVAHTLAARVYAEDLDDNSYDNCQEIIIEVRREDDKLALIADGHDPEVLWGPYVEFTDEDLTDGSCKATYTVEFRVTEARMGGLSSTCWGLVTIENKTAPIASAPADIYLDCMDHSPVFGEAEIWGACNSDFEIETEVLVDNDCNYGVIYHSKRTWTPYTVVDDARHYGIPVSQSIIVENIHDVRIEFPLDIEVDCNVDGEIPAPLEMADLLMDNGCGEWQVTVSDKYYASVVDADCKKIIREYEFINWCTWDYDDTEIAVVNRPNDLILEDGQQVQWSFVDADLDGTNDINDDLDGDAYDLLVSGPGSDKDGGFVLIDNGDMPSGIDTYPGTDGINGGQVNYVDGYKYGRFIYRQIIKVVDNKAPELTGSIDAITCDAAATSCELYTDVTASFSATDECSAVALSLQIRLDGTTVAVADTFGTFDGTTVTGRYPAGTHAFVVTARDGCNNLTTKSYEFTVGEECKKPTPVGLATFSAVMENGNVEIWVSDVEAGSSFDNCTAYEDLEFGIEMVSDLNDDGRISASDVTGEMPSETVLYLNCSNVGRVYAALWVRDEAGNTQYTITPIYITDNNEDCGNAGAAFALVSGSITNEADEDIDNVMISVNGSGIDAQESMFDGLFNFNVPMNTQVTISPEKDDNYMNGVSTSDLVLLQRHILGINELNSAYKMIAGDVNNDEKVNTRDMLQLSRLILGVNSDFANNTSWRFVAKDHVFANPTSPWGFDEVVNVSNLSADQQANFVGIKVGDLSGNARPSNLLGDEAKSGLLSIAINDQTVSADDVAEVALMASDFNDVAGFQFTLNLTDAVEVLDVVPGAITGMSDANFNLNDVNAGIITAYWANAEATQLADDEVLFTVQIRATQAVSLSEVITINSAVTAAEAYDGALNVMNVKPLFIGGAEADVVLHQNTPNPFNGATVIGFDLPQSDVATLKIMNISGQVIKVISGNYQKGYNQVSVAADDLNATGVLYYELTSSNVSMTKKMVIVE